MIDFLNLMTGVAEAGCLYGLVALAFLLVLKPTGIANFCTGEWAMLGAMLGVTWVVNLAVPYIIALPATVICCGLLAYATERVVVRPLIERGAPPLAPVLTLLGMLIVFREAVGWIYGKANLFAPPPLGFAQLAVGPLSVGVHTLLIVTLTLAVFAASWAFFEKTVWGKAFQAAAIDRFAASLMGINLGRVTGLSFFAAGAMAGLAGILQSPITSAHYLLGLPLAIKGFSALVIGGVGSVEGALYGGLLLALTERVTIRYAPIPSGFALGIPLLLIILFLIVRPGGLISERR